jgi:hypothetical protein
LVEELFGWRVCDFDEEGKEKVVRESLYISQKGANSWSKALAVDHLRTRCMTVAERVSIPDIIGTESEIEYIKSEFRGEKGVASN